MNRKERRALKTKPEYMEISIPPNTGINDGDLITIKAPHGYYLNYKTGEPQVFKAKIEKMAT